MRDSRTVLAAAEQLDRTCEEFVDEFYLGTPDEATRGRVGMVQDIDMGLGMAALYVEYRTVEQQEAFIRYATDEALLAEGNPSAVIKTCTDTSDMAGYKLDRTTGLIVVNEFDFPQEEVRALRSSDVQALELSMGTRGLIKEWESVRCLTEEGILRLVSDIKIAIRDA